MLLGINMKRAAVELAKEMAQADRMLSNSRQMMIVNDRKIY